MCGRFALGLERAQIRGLPGYPHLAVGEWIDEDDFVPRYNIAPNTNAPVIRRAPVQDAPAPLVMHTMRWGIHYGKDDAKAINARCENLVQGIGMWNKYRGKNRCVIVCQGYYEWQTKGKDKLPYFTKLPNGKIMLIAGLYDEAAEKNQSWSAYSFAIITTHAGKVMDWLHDRQPVIFSTEDEVNRWLDTSSHTWSSDLAHLLHPWEDANTPLQCYQVPKEVGKVGTESPKFIEPIVNRKDGIMAMFAKQRLKQEQVKAYTKRKRSSTPPLSSTSDTVIKTEDHEEKKTKLE